MGLLDGCNLKVSPLLSVASTYIQIHWDVRDALGNISTGELNFLSRLGAVFTNQKKVKIRSYLRKNDQILIRCLD